MADPRYKKLQEFLDETNDYVKIDAFKEAFVVLHASLELLTKSTEEDKQKIVSSISDELTRLETGFKTRLSSTNADLGTKASKTELQKALDTIESMKADLDLAYLNIEEVRSEIPEQIKADDVAELIIKKRDLIPVEVIQGGKNLISKTQLETAIIEIGGKLTVMEKRLAKGYGALGGGSEGTGSLNLSRLRDVNLSGLSKDSNGKYLLGSGTGSGGGGTSDHALLTHLDYASSGHTGFQPAGTYSTDIHGNISSLNLVSGTNTGDETLSTIKTKLGITTLSGSNTGDQTSVTGNAGTVTSLAGHSNTELSNGAGYITSSSLSPYLPLAGGTMTGTLVLATGSTSKAPIKMVAGAKLTTPMAGVLEFDGTDLFFTI